MAAGKHGAEIGRWLALATVCLGLLLLPQPHAPHRVAAKPAAKHRVPPKHVVVVAARPKPPPHPPPPPPPPSKPSIYDTEDAMSVHALMDRWDPLVLVASRRFKVPQPWILAVIRMESGGRTVLAGDRPIVSSAGAMGLMQLMPESYREMRAQYGLGRDPFDPQDNILAGTAFLSLLHAKYGYPQMFAAYNDGPGGLEAHLAGLRPLPGETVSYIQGIIAILSGGSGRAGGKAKLTRPDGTAVLVDAGAVITLRAPLPGEYADSVHAVIGIARLRQGVRESVAETRAILLAHGGGI